MGTGSTATEGASGLRSLILAFGKVDMVSGTSSGTLPTEGLGLTRRLLQYVNMNCTATPGAGVHSYMYDKTVEHQREIGSGKLPLL